MSNVGALMVLLVSQLVLELITQCVCSVECYSLSVSD